jgi:hypothetical protein
MPRFSSDQKPSIVHVLDVAAHIFAPTVVHALMDAPFADAVVDARRAIPKHWMASKPHEDGSWITLQSQPAPVKGVSCSGA